MPPAPLLDVVRHAARDDGVGDEVRPLSNARSRCFDNVASLRSLAAARRRS